MCATQSNAVAIMSRFRTKKTYHRVTDALFWRETSVSVSASNHRHAHSSTPFMAHLNLSRSYVFMRIRVDSRFPFDIHLFAMVLGCAAKCENVSLSHLRLSHSYESTLKMKMRELVGVRMAGSHGITDDEFNAIWIRFDFFNISMTQTKTKQLISDQRQPISEALFNYGIVERAMSSWVNAQCGEM